MGEGERLRKLEWERLRKLEWERLRKLEWERDREEEMFLFGPSYISHNTYIYIYIHVKL